MATNAAASAILPGVLETTRRVWFDRGGCVEQLDDGRKLVLVGGSAVGLYEASDPASRDVLAVMIASTGINRQKLAHAFGVSDGTIERAITRFNRGGLEAVADTGDHGGRRVRTPSLRARLEKLFEQGHGPRAAHRAVSKRAGYGTVQDMHAQWSEQKAKAEAAIAAGAAAPAQAELVLESTSTVDDEPREAASTMGAMPEASPAAEENVAKAEEIHVGEGDVEETTGARAESDESELAEIEEGGGDDSEEETLDLTAPPMNEGDKRKEMPIEEAVASSSGKLVQHAGAWLLLGMLQALGVYELANKWRGKSVGAVMLRVAIDAAAIALAVGHKCVEGVRRLETPTATTLLRHRGGASASWVRRVLHRFAGTAATMWQATVASALLKRSAEGQERVWLYVDNHTRPYTGKHVIRKGWRMQDKCAVPGVSDYYVHDEDGFPLWCIASPEHESLCTWLAPVVDFAKLALGGDVVPALVFDRGGSFPMMMATLRAHGGEFVTYERKPYALLTETSFDQQLTLVLASRPSKPIVVRYTEAAQKNLGGARGRVRRIACLMDDGAQINILAVSTLPAEELIRKQLARWGCQENQLKHEVERWGINQLDGRKVVPYPPDAIIPNPDRRKLDRKLRLSSTAEGAARCELARLAPDHPRRARLEEDVRRAVEQQTEIASLRVSVPARAAVKQTSLAGKLKKHPQQYKTVLNTLRIALANAEADLALRLATHLERPREAKKLLAHLLLAPGVVRVTDRSVSVRLAPAATRAERAAIAAFLRAVNRLRLHLPGDPSSRTLRFGLMPTKS